MALAKRKYRVCGEPYEACGSAKRNPDVFVWQEVACSLNCGSIYLEQIYDSRNIQLANAIAAVETDEPASAVITSDEPEAPAVKKRAAEKVKPVLNQRRQNQNRQVCRELLKNPLNRLTTAAPMR